MAIVPIEGTIAARSTLTGLLLPIYPLSYVSSHIEQGLANLVEQFKDKPKIASLLTSFLNQIQDLEDAFWTLLWDRYLDVATGVSLDGLGDIVGESREGREDDAYRQGIKTRILINLSSGTPEEILAIFVSFFSGTSYHLMELPPAYFKVRVLGKMPDEPTVLQFHNLLQEIKAAGVGAGLHYQLVEEGNVFQFSSSDSIENDSNTGFANDTQTTGGTWSDIYGS
jgi:hypothetical protein